jgi:hypothetical protein
MPQFGHNKSRVWQNYSNIPHFRNIMDMQVWFNHYNNRVMDKYITFAKFTAKLVIAANEEFKARD